MFLLIQSTLSFPRFEQTLQEEKKQCLILSVMMYVNHVAKQTDGWSEQKWPNMCTPAITAHCGRSANGERTECEQRAHGVRAECGRKF